jgi:hypothetical protein
MCLRRAWWQLRHDGADRARSPRLEKRECEPFVRGVRGTLRRHRDSDDLPDQYFSDCVERCEEVEESVRRNYEE